jgi:hypothetical protein
MNARSRRSSQRLPSLEIVGTPWPGGDVPYNDDLCF